MKRGDYFLVRLIINIDESHVVILTVRPPALRFVVVLKPMCADNVRTGGEILKSPLNNHRSLCLGGYLKQMPGVFVPAPVFHRGTEEFGNQNRFARESCQSLKEIMR